MATIQGSGASAGAQDDIEGMIREAMPWVELAAQRFPCSAADRADLIAQAHMALVVAARSYDPQRGTPWRVWAQFRIRGAIVDALSVLRGLPRHVHARLSDEQQCHAHCAGVLEAVTPSSTPLPDSDLALALRDLSESVTRLPADERAVMELYCRGVPLDEIVTHTRSTKRRVCHIRVQAIARLRRRARTSFPCRPPKKTEPTEAISRTRRVVAHDSGLMATPVIDPAGIAHERKRSALEGYAP